MKENLEEILEQEFNKEAEQISKETADYEAANPEFSERKVTDSMKRDFLDKLHEKTNKTADDEALLAQMSEEGREAYRLGKELLERRERKNKGKSGQTIRICARKKKAYLTAACVAVLVLVCGTNSFGARTYVMDFINQVKNGINRIVMNSEEEGRQYSERETESIYLEINEKLGLEAVELVYLPEQYELEELDIDAVGLYAYLKYSWDDESWIRYYIYSNHADQSVSVYKDDELLEKDEKVISNVPVEIAKYRNVDSLIYYEVQFTYHQVNYELISTIPFRELEKVLKNLFFP